LDKGEGKKDGTRDQEYETIRLEFKCEKHCDFNKITGQDSLIREIEKRIRKRGKWETTWFRLDVDAGIFQYLSR